MSARLAKEVRDELANKVLLGQELNYKDKRALQTPQANPRKSRDIIKTHIKAVRESLGMSAYELCRISGVHAGNLNKFEHGTMNATLSQLMKLSEAMGVPIDTIVYGNLDNIDKDMSKELIELRLLKKNMHRLLD